MVWHGMAWHGMVWYGMVLVDQIAEPDEMITGPKSE